MIHWNCAGAEQALQRMHACCLLPARLRLHTHLYLITEMQRPKGLSAYKRLVMWFLFAAET